MRKQGAELLVPFGFQESLWRQRKMVATVPQGLESVWANAETVERTSVNKHSEDAAGLDYHH